MSAERWMKGLEMFDKVRQRLHTKEKAEAAEEEAIRQEAEKRAWLKELEQRDSDGSCTLPTDERGKNGVQNTGHNV